MEGKWGDAVFDDDGILTFTDENGNPVRVDRQGRLVCNAHLLKDATKLCRAPIVGGCECPLLAVSGVRTGLGLIGRPRTILR